MKRKLIAVFTVVAPVFLLLLGRWVAGFATFTEAPTWGNPAYGGQCLFYLLVAAFLFFLLSAEYTGKMRLALVIPCLYLLFFSLPYGLFWEEMGSAFLFFHAFFPGYPCVFILLFSFLFKLAQALKRG